jgi:DNA repair protein RadC
MLLDNKHMNIADLPAIEKPREKLMRYGVKRLTNTELIAIILRSGSAGKSVLVLADEVNSIVHKATSIETLSNIKGMGTAKSVEIVASIELGKRMYSNESIEVMNAESIWKEMRQYRSSKKEHFVAFYLNSRSKLIHSEVISIGTINESIVHPREVFEPALSHSATSIIVAHNHPSGSIEPSTADLVVTDRLKKAGKILGITLLDHLIVTQDSWHSIVRF